MSFFGSKSVRFSWRPEAFRLARMRRIGLGIQRLGISKQSHEKIQIVKLAHGAFPVGTIACETGFARCGAEDHQTVAAFHAQPCPSDDLADLSSQRRTDLHLVRERANETGAYRRNIHFHNKNCCDRRNADEECRKVKSAEAPLRIQCDNALDCMSDNVTREQPPLFAVGLVCPSCHGDRCLVSSLHSL